MSPDIAILRARLEGAVAMDAPAPTATLTVGGLAALYSAHALKRYNGRHGRKEHNTIRLALEPLIMLYGGMHPDQLRPLHLMAARQYWLDPAPPRKPISRTTIQTRMQRIRRCWKWARRRELITRDLPEIDPLPFGHAIEAEPVEPVSVDLYEATLAVVGPVVKIMLRVLYLTGMRPGEVCDMRGAEIETSGGAISGAWRYRPTQHKTRWCGGKREIFLGPQVQLLLQPLLTRYGDGYLFWTARGNRFRTGLLYNAVFKACKKLGRSGGLVVGPGGPEVRWHPNQLRHTRLTEIRERMGLDAAQAVAGHARIETTQVYSAKQMHLAREAALKFG